MSEEIHQSKLDQEEPAAKPRIPKGYRLGARSSGSTDLADSKLAGCALTVGQIVSLISCVGVAIGGIVAVVLGISEVKLDLVVCSVIVTPIAVLLEFAFFVVFTRVKRL